MQKLGEIGKLENFRPECPQRTRNNRKVDVRLLVLCHAKCMPVAAMTTEAIAKTADGLAVRAKSAGVLTVSAENRCMLPQQGQYCTRNERG